MINIKKITLLAALLFMFVSGNSQNINKKISPTVTFCYEYGKFDRIEIIVNRDLLAVYNNTGDLMYTLEKTAYGAKGVDKYGNLFLKIYQKSNGVDLYIIKNGKKFFYDSVKYSNKNKNIILQKI